MTALQNVALPLLAEGTPNALHRAREVLEVLEFGEFDALPETLDLFKRRLLEVARAVVASPRLLVIDELLAGLADSECETYIGSLMRLKADYG
ncbi:MAG: lipoprotein-releasing system ATP-binding protein LolD, partial [Candidatus Bipolaricaulota bacterium]|nr:lipoprotein-releasing system ATP-binding protein LolD [Candidatus Bipolaricaulota bacterium]